MKTFLFWVQFRMSNDAVHASIIFLSTNRHLATYTCNEKKKKKKKKKKTSAFTPRKHFWATNTPFNPTLYRKTGACVGILKFLILNLKHTLWVLVRTASPRRF